MPNNNQLPFLDTLVTWNPDTQIFTTTSGVASPTI